MNVFAKIFAQIFDSSISADYVVRHVFMDLLVLADRDGVVDMTLDAIARRTNVPKKIVAHCITELSKEDSDSRSHQENGRRLIPLDSHRAWGWQIVNYEHYRQIRDEESRKAYFRDYKRKYRAGASTPVLDSPHESTKAYTSPSKDVSPSSSVSTEGISPEMMARGLAERLGISLGYGPTSFNTAVTEVAATEQKAGRNLEDVCTEMEAAYQYYLQEKPNLRIQWGPANFFGQGHWRDPNAWPRKAKTRQQETEEWRAPDDDDEGS